MNYFDRHIKQPKQYWCKKHLFGYWIEPYKQCAQGFAKKEECIKGNLEEVKEDE